MSGSAQKVIISDESGQRLAEATPWLSDDGLVMALGRVRGGGELLAYYFGKSRRTVRVALGEFAVAGRLQTRWQGSRRTWLIRLESPAPLAAAPAEAPNGPPASRGKLRADGPGTAPKATLPSGGRP